jgi:antiphage defense system Thoeris ThsB-like protein
MDKTELEVSYRNKTYVAFASEDIKHYWMMEAWRDNQHIDFDFYDAHDLYVARDTSQPESIKARLRERIKNAKQVVLLGSAAARAKGGNGTSFLAYEVGAILRLELPVVVANLDGDTNVTSFIPQPLLDADYYTMSVSFRPAIIKYALDNYAEGFASSDRSGSYYYPADVYQRLGLK